MVVLKLSRSLRAIILMAVSMVAFSYHSSGQNAKHSALWVGKPIVVDGANDEWPSPYPFSDPVAKIQYAIANDSAMLYVSVKSSDDVIKGKFLRTGLTLFIDTKNGKDESLYFDFLVDSIKQKPSAQQDDSLSDTLAQGRDFFQKQRQEPSVPVGPAPPISLRMIAIAGTEKYDGKYAIQKAPAGVAVAAATNDVSEMVWEMAIPFSVFSKDPNALLERKISIALVEYPLTPEEFDEVMKLAQASPFSAKPGGHNSSAAGSRKNGDAQGGTQSETKSGMRGGRGGGGMGGGGMSGGMTSKGAMGGMNGMGSNMGGETPGAGGTDNTGSEMPRHSKMDDVETVNEIITSSEPSGDKWLRANTRNQTWQSIRLSGGK